ncbi:unnamed protein product [Linum tenue]|uniref:Protein kinase domain-containing protein n=1 Tax=Linum tenue TaxID=586396 RepID=A0AAV0N3Z0_9ROSI|nr:unnamed protein product [Linum tenue]
MGHFLLPLYLQAFLFLFLTGVVADDSFVLLKLAKSISPLPPGWSSKSSIGFCNWKGIKCDSSNTKVTSISLSNLGVSGTLPPEISTLTHLETLSLQNNNFQGPLPSLSKLPNLQSVFLDNNNFSSIPPGFFKNLVNLQTLSIGNNLNLPPWQIPSQDLLGSPLLSSFLAQHANIFGSIPDMFGPLVSLQNLKLSYNNLTGPLPQSMANSSIQNLWLNNQEMGLSGNLHVLAGMSQLSQVWVHNNQFTGPIPNLSKCDNLYDLQLRDNQLTGIVPVDMLASLPKLSNISLSNNKFQGPVPIFPSRIKVVNSGANNFCAAPGVGCSDQVKALLQVAEAFGYPTSLSDKWEGNDPCSRWSFITCDPDRKNVTTINLAKQGFAGKISPAFAQLASLQFLYLNENNLTGLIPDSLTTLPQLKVVDLSNNNLSGRIPVFSSHVKLTLYPGNKFLGTNIDTSATGGASSTEPEDPTNGTGYSSKISKWVIVAIVVLVFLFVLAIVLFVLLRYKKMKKKGKKIGDEEGKLMFGKGGKGNNKEEVYIVADELHGRSPQMIGGKVAAGQKIIEDPSASMSIEVLRQVTDNFSEKKIIGKGGFGVVYKGDLHDGTQVAVKRMESGPMGSKGLKEFQAEIAVLSNVRHRHLVAFLGYCINESERLLVYEYMSRGTLGQHLFDQHRHGTLPLTWKQRITIALDVARGVEYLHSLAQQSFIHRDLKPSNILLGDDMRAKVSDFGLVKHATDGKQSMETRLAGTFGYLAPEYATTGRVSRKADVYAFGVILMELITGRKALDDTVEDETSHLVTWFRMMMNSNKNNIQAAIDSALTIHNQDQDYESTLEAIHKVAQLAGHCTATEPSQRPEMGHAVNVLAPLVEQWTPSNNQYDQSSTGDQEQKGSGIDLNMTLPQALQRWKANEDVSTTFAAPSLASTNDTMTAPPNISSNTDADAERTFNHTSATDR